MKKLFFSFCLLVTATSFAQEMADLDPSFNADPVIGVVTTIEVQDDNKILVVHHENQSSTAYSLHRLNADGSIDDTFSSGLGTDGWMGVTPLSDGKMFIYGSFTQYNGTPVNKMAKLNADGSIDTSFIVSALVGSIKAIALQPDGKIMIGGDFTINSRHNIARLHPNGVNDNTFVNPVGYWLGPDNPVNTIAIQADGKIIIGGNFFHYGPHDTPYRLARLNPNGSFDATFNPQCSISVGYDVVKIRPDGKILVGGFLFGNTNLNFYQLNADGSLDSNFPTLPTFGSITDIDVLHNGQVLICGPFASYGTTDRYGVVLLNVDGSLDTNFNPNTEDEDPILPPLYINSTAVQNDGKILIGGSMTDYKSTPVNHVARLMGSEELHVNDVVKEDNSLKYYPNPVNNILSLNSPTDISQVAVYDIQGREVIAQTWNKAAGDIDMSSLQSGSYIVKIATENTTKEVIVIKK